MSKIKFYNSLKNLSVEIENIKNENVGVWLEENIVHIQNNNELIAKGRHIFSNEKMIRFAGNSIVVNVLENIFEQMLEISDLLNNKK